MKSQLCASLIIGTRCIIHQLLREDVLALGVVFKDVNRTGIGRTRKRASDSNGSIVDCNREAELINCKQVIRHDQLRWGSGQCAVCGRKSRFSPIIAFALGIDKRCATKRGASIRCPCADDDIVRH